MSPRIVAPTARIVAPTARIAAPTALIAAPTALIAALAGLSASVALAHPLVAAHRLPARAAHAGVLSGTWTGYISRRTSSGTLRQKIVIEVNARETRGTWQLGPPACHGTLTLQSISGGYHHYLRHIAAGAPCAGGDVDCLMPQAGAMYDSVTSHIGGAYDETGTLKRIRS